MKNSILVLIFVLASCTVPVSADTCDEFNKLLDKTYNFKPSKLTVEQITAKSAELDVVWEKVKADKSLEACLRKAMDSRREDRFFRFNASNLLIQLDENEENKKLLLQMYGEVDLADINLRYWIPYIVSYGYVGYDTSLAGDNWLRFPDPKYYLPQHGTLAVNKVSGALIIYGSMDESYATPALLRIASDKAHPGREIAVYLLTLQATAESFRGLSELDQTGLAEVSKTKIKTLLSQPSLLQRRSGEPKISRDEYLVAFKELVDQKPGKFMELASKVTDGEKDAIAVLTAEDVPLIRKARRFWASTGTPHAPEWYRSFTDILLALVWKSEMQKANIKSMNVAAK